MGFKLPIPKDLQHLKTDCRGYPIPYFIEPVKEGDPDFRFINPERLMMIYQRKVCHICGLKLPKDYCYFISGPVGLQNRVSTDAGMHKVCAEFSLQACPHLFFKKSDYRTNDDIGKEINQNSPPHLIKEKPLTLFLVKASKFHVIPGELLLKYTSVSSEEFIYINNLLTKK